MKDFALNDAAYFERLLSSFRTSNDTHIAKAAGKSRFILRFKKYLISSDMLYLYIRLDHKWGTAAISGLKLINFHERSWSSKSVTCSRGRCKFFLTDATL